MHPDWYTPLADNQTFGKVQFRALQKSAANISNVRYNRSMTERDECENCGGPIPRRTDPRGRKARYCSDACRAAASRKRREQRHRDALAEARNQMSLNLRTPAEEAAEATKVVRSMVQNLHQGREFPITEQHQELVAAIRELAQILDAAVAAEDAAPATKMGGNRAQRRAAKRRR